MTFNLTEERSADDIIQVWQDIAISNRKFAALAKCEEARNYHLHIAMTWEKLISTK